MISMLEDIVYQYQLQAQGTKFWVPYWINQDEPPFWLDAPYVGKGTPDELSRELGRLSLEQEAADQPANAEAWRQWFRQAGLGVDCSGFVYYVAGQWLRSRGLELADMLLVDRAEILERHERRPELAARWDGVDIPMTMFLGEACYRWGTSPAMITNVARLTDPRVVERVERAADTQAGDFIHMSHDGSEHIGIVLSVTSGEIRYADSAHEPPGLGGVAIRRIVVAAPNEGLEMQTWDQLRIFHPEVAGSRDGVWRLRMLESIKKA
jgi:hypothetical protein